MPGDSSAVSAGTGKQVPAAVSGGRGLRERKRAALHSTIERAALDLALQHGYDNLTIDMICEASMISPRTFFNYFGSREAVIVGPPPPLPTQEAVDAFAARAGSDVLGDFVSLVTTTLLRADPEPDLYRSRRILTERNPELFNRRLALIADLEEQFVQIILRRFAAQGRSENECASDLQDEARMIVAVTTGVIRFATQKWVSPDFTGTTAELLSACVMLTRRVAGNVLEPAR